MPKKKPQRMCVSCRRMADKKELIRLVASSDGEVSIDPAGRKPGRGAYVCRNRQCLTDAVRGRKIDRGLKKKVDDQVIRMLVAAMEALPADEEESSAAAGQDNHA